MIAGELKISSGNLTYHFRHKRDLRLASLEVLQDRLDIALAKPVDVASAQAAGEHLARLFRTFWEFRFFFNELTYLLSEDADIRKQFALVKASALDSIERDITFLQAKGYFASPRSPNTFGLLAENMWALLLHWLRMQQIESPFALMPKNRALYDCSLRLWSILEPWMEATFAKQLLVEFEKLFGIKGRSRSEYLSAKQTR
jgi:AcrR family transcriptional regulator